MKHRNLLWAILGLCIMTGRAAHGAGAEVWVEIRSPNFIVMSNAPAKQARRAADRLEQFRNVIHVSLPKLRIDPGMTLRVFAARDEASFKALLPREFLKKGMTQPAGIFQAGQEKNFVLLRLDLPSEQGYHVIYHEYVHMVMRLNFRTLPVWLSEGFADFFGQATLSDSESGIGRPSPQQIETLQKGQLMPLDVMMAADHDSPYYRQENKSGLFYAQSWALTHYLMLGDKRAHTGQLIQYLDQILSNVPESQAAERAFGDLKVLQQKLDQYVRPWASTTTGWLPASRPRKPNTPPEPLSMRNILRQKGT
ncbi:MAG: DUF1570 domain-containing protein [Acidobacteriia bacterium]|nr:DUF1570 domain-containing protein [Terriglobia bacterium]